MKMKKFHPAKKRIEVTVGESVRIMRELQELSQSQLSELTGISQATISAIENAGLILGLKEQKSLPARYTATLPCWFFQGGIHSSRKLLE